MATPNPIIVENLERAIVIMEQTPERLVNLDYYTQQSVKCGTLHCTAGWLASNEHFQEQGMVLGAGGGLNIAATQGLRHLFGESAKSNLFSPACCAGVFDAQVIVTALGRPMTDKEKNAFHYEDQAPITHKEMAVGRLKRQLEKVLTGELE